MNQLYLYFSGTGNTKWAVHRFAEKYNSDSEKRIHSIEEVGIDFDTMIKNSDMVMIAYPIYGSMMPENMERFLKLHLESLAYKPIMVLTTQMKFSGDGAGLACYILNKANVKILATMHLNMPHNVVDMKIFRQHSDKEINRILIKADKKITSYINRIKQKRKVKTGRAFYSRILGLLTQRMFYRWFYQKMKKMVRIDDDRCIACGKCVESCPAHNLILTDGKISTKNDCYVCYRCINICPTKAIRIMGKSFPRQQYFKK
ncbi:MAG TPA: EFR1 family ferrodoxin [Bacillota bacterium]|nr:EFR1 family ferrodoxin [Bacillota bacterium]